MERDALNRRKRTARPAPSSTRLNLSEADLCIFRAIDRHGPLPSHYLYELTRHIRRDRSHLQNRLTEFYNGDAGGPYLTRPPHQFASFTARYLHLVYDLAPRGAALLAERGLTERHGNGRGEPFVHRLMGSCAMASIELAALARGLQYIPLSEVVARPSCAAHSAPNPLAVPLSGGATLIPDRLFGLHYPDVGYRFFAVECDRNTESIERRNLRQSSLARKFAGYVELLRTQAYRSWWGIPNLHVLVITTSETHARNILDHLRRETPPSLVERFAISAEPVFGADWRVPAAPLSHLLTQPWQTPEGIKEIGKS